ncbi:unnamed protein product, partial [Effrenium voratum]
ADQGGDRAREDCQKGAKEGGSGTDLNKTQTGAKFERQTACSESFAQPPQSCQALNHTATGASLKVEHQVKANTGILADAKALTATETGASGFVDAYTVGATGIQAKAAALEVKLTGADFSVKAFTADATGLQVSAKALNFNHDNLSASLTALAASAKGVDASAMALTSSSTCVSASMTLLDANALGAAGSAKALTFTHKTVSLSADVGNANATGASGSATAMQMDMVGVETNLGALSAKATGASASVNCGNVKVNLVSNSVDFATASACGASSSVKAGKVNLQPDGGSKKAFEATAMGAMSTVDVGPEFLPDIPLGKAAAFGAVLGVTFIPIPAPPIPFAFPIAINIFKASETRGNDGDTEGKGNKGDNGKGQKSGGDDSGDKKPPSNPKSGKEARDDGKENPERRQPKGASSKPQAKPSSEQSSSSASGSNDKKQPRPSKMEGNGASLFDELAAMFEPSKAQDREPEAQAPGRAQQDSGQSHAGDCRDSFGVKVKEPPHLPPQRAENESCSSKVPEQPLKKAYTAKTGPDQKPGEAPALKSSKKGEISKPPKVKGEAVRKQAQGGSSSMSGDQVGSSSEAKDQQKSQKDHPVVPDKLPTTGTTSKQQSDSQIPKSRMCDGSSTQNPSTNAMGKADRVEDSPFAETHSQEPKSSPSLESQSTGSKLNPPKPVKVTEEHLRDVPKEDPIHKFARHDVRSDQQQEWQKRKNQAEAQQKQAPKQGASKESCAKEPRTYQAAAGGEAFYDPKLQCYLPKDLNSAADRDAAKALALDRVLKTNEKRVRKERGNTLVAAQCEVTGAATAFSSTRGPDNKKALQEETSGAPFVSRSLEQINREERGNGHGFCGEVSAATDFVRRNKEQVEKQREEPSKNHETVFYQPKFTAYRTDDVKKYADNVVKQPDLIVPPCASCEKSMASMQVKAGRPPHAPEPPKAPSVSSAAPSSGVPNDFEEPNSQNFHQRRLEGGRWRDVHKAHVQDPRGFGGDKQEMRYKDTGEKAKDVPLAKIGPDRAVPKLKIRPGKAGDQSTFAHGEDTAVRRDMRKVFLELTQPVLG